MSRILGMRLDDVSPETFTKYVKDMGSPGWEHYGGTKPSKEQMKHLKDIKDWKECINQVVMGECLEGMKLIPDKSIDAIICDLPYGTTACTWDTVIPFDKLWEQYKRIVKDNAPIVLFGSQPFTTDLIMSNRKWFRYEWIWEKGTSSNPFYAKQMPLRRHENIVVFSKKQSVYYPQLYKGKPSHRQGNMKGNLRTIR